MLRHILINPMLEKEFRLRMRSIRAPLAVLMYAATIGILAMAYIYMEMSGRHTFNPQDSREMFMFLSMCQLVLLMFMTPGLTAGVISGEREKQTLGMLLTTQQSSRSIILSKLFSSLSFMLLVMFATIPVYSIVFLYGGISPGQLLAVFGFYLFTMFMLGSVGTFCSTVFRKTVVAIIATYGFVIAINGLTFLAAVFLLETIARNTAVGGYLMGFNPVGALISIMDDRFSEEVFNSRSNLQLWHIYFPAYTVFSIVLLASSIKFLRPTTGKR